MGSAADQVSHILAEQRTGGAVLQRAGRSEFSRKARASISAPLPVPLLVRTINRTSTAPG